MNYLRGLGSGSAPPPAPPQDNFIMVNEGGSINSNNILAGANRCRQDGGRSIQGSTQGQNQRGGGTQQGGSGRVESPPKFTPTGPRTTSGVKSLGPTRGGGGPRHNGRGRGTLQPPQQGTTTRAHHTGGGHSGTNCTDYKQQ